MPHKKRAVWLLAIVAVLAAIARPARPEAVIANTPPERSPQMVYKITAENGGDVFPAFAQYASSQNPSERTFGVVRVTITNPTDNFFHALIRVNVPGWSDEEMQYVELQPGDVGKFVFAPTFLPRLFSNREITPATAHVVIGNFIGTTYFEGTVPLRLRAAEDMFWGDHFKNAAFIASWVTPHDTRVEYLLRRAKEYMPGRRLPGYEPWKSTPEQVKSTYAQAKAIFNALKIKGVSYVKSSTTFGNFPDLTQRIRLPKDTLAQNSANCIDAAVMYASAFENLGMDPMIVLVPGHAYVGVRSAQRSPKFLFFDAALTSRVSFEEAVWAADTGMSREPAAEVTQIPIENARRAGIFPMP